jgi:hypothetical protein
MDLDAANNGLGGHDFGFMFNIYASPVLAISGCDSAKSKSTAAKKPTRAAKVR